MPDTRSYLFLLGFVFSLFVGEAFANGTMLQDGDQIEIRDVSVVISRKTIIYSATYINRLDSNVTFDAVIRLDDNDNDNVLALDPYRISLRPRAAVIIQGMFAVEREGNYTVQWEALSLPPGENISGRQRVQVEGEFEFDSGIPVLSLVLVIIISSIVVSIVMLLLRKTRIRKTITMEEE